MERWVLELLQVNVLFGDIDLTPFPAPSSLMLLHHCSNFIFFFCRDVYDNLFSSSGLLVFPHLLLAMIVEMFVNCFNTMSTRELLSKLGIPVVRDGS